MVDIITLLHVLHSMRVVRRKVGGGESYTRTRARLLKQVDLQSMRISQINGRLSTYCASSKPSVADLEPLKGGSPILEMVL